MPGKKYYKKRSTKRPTYSKKINKLAKQVKAIQINDKPESKFMIFTKILTPGYSYSGIPQFSNKQLFSLYNNIAPGQDQQSRIGAQIKPKKMKMRIYIPATLSSCLLQFLVFKVRDAKYDQNVPNVMKYFNDVTTFNGCDPNDPIRYQHIIPLKRMIISPSATAYERIIQPKAFNLSGNVTYENFTTSQSSAAQSNVSLYNVEKGEIFVLCSMTGGCPSSVN